MAIRTLIQYLIAHMIIIHHRHRTMISTMLLGMLMGHLGRYHEATMKCLCPEQAHILQVDVQDRHEKGLHSLQGFLSTMSLMDMLDLISIILHHTIQMRLCAGNDDVVGHQQTQLTFSRTNLAVQLVNGQISPPAKYAQLQPKMTREGRFPVEFRIARTVEEVQAMDCMICVLDLKLEHR